MPGTQPPSLFESVAAELRALGLTITIRPGEYCVNFRDRTEATGYFTDELQDALEHGRAMAADRPSAPPAWGKSSLIRRKWRRPMSAKTQRRRRIRAHNHRMRGRAIKRLRDDAHSAEDRG